MKLKIGSPTQEVPEEVPRAITPYVEARHADPRYDPLVMWALKHTPERDKDGLYTLSNLTTADLSITVDTLAMAGIEAMEVVRRDTNVWDINYYE